MKTYDFACRVEGCLGRTNFTHKLCLDCWEDKQRENWEKMPVVEWDEEGMLYSETKGEFYDDMANAVDDLAYDSDKSADDLRLVVCVPMKPPHFDIGEWVEGRTHDDWEPDAEDGAIEDKINELLQSMTGLGWEPGRTRPDTSKIQAAVDAERVKTDA